MLSFNRIPLGPLALLAMLAQPAYAEDAPSKLSSVSLDVNDKEVIVRLVGTKAPDFTGFTEKNPERVVVDLSDAVIELPSKKLEYAQGLVKRVEAETVEVDSETVVRVTVELRKATTFRFEMSGNSVLVRLVKVDVPVEAVKAEPKKEAPAKAAPKSQVTEAAPEGPLTERTDVPPPPTERKVKLDEGPAPPVVSVAPPPEPPPPPPPPVVVPEPTPKIAAKVEPAVPPVTVPPEPEQRKTIAKWVPPPAEKKPEFDPGNHVMTYIGFRQKSVESEVFVRLDSKAEYKISRNGNRVSLELPKTRVNVRNNERELDTSFFPSYVTRVQAVTVGAGTRIDIDLRDEVEPRVDRIGTTIAVSFPAPGN